MLGTAIIVFREVLEASLIVGIVMATTSGLHARGIWVAAGVLAGLTGAAIVAGLADKLAEAASGLGQELFNAIVLFIAVFMLGWHNVWMQQHGRELAREMSQVGRAVLSGERSLWALVVVVTLAVLREGSEVVLFLYGTAGSPGGGSQLLGGLFGVVLGAAVGFGLYAGMLRIPHRHLFGVLSALIVFLAAGLASQGAAYLVEADVLPPLGHDIWNTSDILDEKSLPGQILHTLIGYASRPDGIQLVFYLVTLTVIPLLMRLTHDQSPPQKPSAAA